MGVPGWVQLEALKLPGSFVALASRIAGAPSRHSHDVLLPSALGRVLHAGASDRS